MTCTDENVEASSICTLNITKGGQNVNNGDTILPDDVLTITATILDDDYEVSTFTVNGNDFTNGGTFTVPENLTGTLNVIVIVSVRDVLQTYEYNGLASGSDSVDVLNLYEYDENDLDGFGATVNQGDDMTVDKQYIFEIQCDDEISSISLIDSDDDVIQTGIHNGVAFTLAQGEYTDSEVYVLIATEPIEDDEPEPFIPPLPIGG